MARQMLQQVQAGAIRPVQVVQRAGRGRCSASAPGSSLTCQKSRCCALRSSTLRSALSARRPGRAGDGPPRASAPPAAPAAGVSACHGQGERFEEGIVGDGLLRLVAAPGENAKALRARQQRDLLRQPRLAHPWLPHQQEQPSLPCATASSAAPIAASSASRPTSGPAGQLPGSRRSAGKGRLVSPSEARWPA